ncbi:Synaptonemal complex protein 2 [Camellia lanceoleosa]|uniref:Synaptonemal complex protein 2 n=1 Tax=Camellia lanceoleosa TaxID=1840588 RepID=A0ACC0GYZ2_9ERIC|nr:Synaptonemal complex protein 2 [Camellia lanceoleosa]
MKNIKMEMAKMMISRAKYSGLDSPNAAPPMSSKNGPPKAAKLPPLTSDASPVTSASFGTISTPLRSLSLSLNLNFCLVAKKMKRLKKKKKKKFFLPLFGCLQLEEWLTIQSFVNFVTVPCVENSDRDLQEVGKEDGRKAWKSTTGPYKLSSSAAALDDLHNQMKTLSLRFESSEETVGNCKRELKELSIEKEERKKYFRDEQCKTTNVIEEKDAMIKHLEATVSATRLDMESLNSKMKELHVGLKFKEDDIQHLRIS